MTTSGSRDHDIAVIGAACRLPGARNLSELWSLLSQARCAVSKIPDDRWSHAAFFHPRKFEPGKTYTWAAGVLDDIWGFDPAVFGISPREAEQMDPQQRLLLELVWEALEDAGIAASSLAGQQVGVFVGASSLDYANRVLFDLPAGDSHFATGNALSVISNRISYIFDLRGPSLTVDTACSSSLVALHEAVTAIQSGWIDTAIVAGVNILASPFAFISFAQASMLSPTGLCRAFDAKADGYVRAEGGVVLVLRSARTASACRNHLWGMVVDCDVNSDGRTNGISLPSSAAQAELLEHVYSRSGVAPNALAFIEAHGTGTRVGDPAEATAIGNVLGQRCTRPLAVGSIKTNIGHLEPAAGLAGMLKALLALQHDFLPASLHFSEPNPDIAFDQFNICVCSKGQKLERGSEPRFAGINSFGFGGTNGHVIVSDPPAAGPSETLGGRGQPALLLSAATREALAALAGKYQSRLERASTEESNAILRAAAHQRDHLPHRTAITSQPEGMTAALREFALGNDHADTLYAMAPRQSLPPAFVYSGNGSQWPGMGRCAYLNNDVFRAHFDEADRRFEKLAGWSLKAAMFDENVDEQLHLTSIAQPLIFAIQCAATAAMQQLGVTPIGVAGHSVGEIAAAQAAGILDLDDALKVIHFRSRHQERTRKRGRMAVLMCESAVAENVVAEIPGLDIAAFNSNQGITVSGTAEAIGELAAAVERRGISLRRLDLDYPFHSRLMDGIEKPLREDLKDLLPSVGRLPLVSTVTGAVVDGRALDAAYWWRNIREPVRFALAIRNLAEMGARAFVEIGPRATLLPHLRNTLEQLSIPFSVLGVLDTHTDADDPFGRAAGKCWVNGIALDLRALAGPPPEAKIELPHYPWQRAQFRLAPTIEALPVVSADWRHPLIGARIMGDAAEWRGHLDPALLPDLQDHKINGKIVLPGAALVEMALAAARNWLDTETAEILDLEILQPLVFGDGGCREISTRVCFQTRLIEVRSRRRLSSEPWQLHATGKIAKDVPPTKRPPVPPSLPSPASGGGACPGLDPGLGRGQETVHASLIYSLAGEVGLQFGPSFQHLKSVDRFGASQMVVSLTEPTSAPGFGLEPSRLDSCFHGLLALFASSDIVAKTMFVPVGFGDVRLFKPGIAPARAIIDVGHWDERVISADFTLLDQQEEIIAVLRGGRFKAVKATKAELADCVLVQTSRPVLMSSSRRATLPEPLPQFADRFQSPLPSFPQRKRVHARLRRAMQERVGEEAGDAARDGMLLLEGWATAWTMSLITAFSSGGSSELDVDRLIVSGRLAPSCRSWIGRLLSWLEASNLVASTQAGWRIVPAPELPDPAAVLLTLSREHPDRGWELLAASRLTRALERMAAGSDSRADFALSPALLSLCETRGTWMGEAVRFLSGVMQTLQTLWPREHGRILQVGFGPLSHPLAALARDHGAGLAVLEQDQQGREQAKWALGRSGVDLYEQPSELPKAAFDLVVAAASLCRGSGAEALIRKLATALTGGGLLLAVEPAPSLFRDVICGTDESWFASDAGGLAPGGRWQAAEDWGRIFRSAGLDDHIARSISIAGETTTFLIGQQHCAAQLEGGREPQSILMRTGSDVRAGQIARHAEKLLITDGHRVLTQGPTDSAEWPLDFVPGTVIHIGDCFHKNGSPVTELRERCLDLKACLEQLSTFDGTLWTLTCGAIEGGSGAANPVEVGYWAFARTAANEFSNIKMKRVDVSPGLSLENAAACLKELILSPGEETELQLDADATRALRIERPVHHATNGQSFASAARLERASSLDGLAWRAVARREPEPNQIEIEVEATGLNFRDVMLALSLLPEEILEGGAAAQCLGVECAGRIVRVGSKVRKLNAGGRVAAFAPWSFATHVTVPAWAVLPVPDHMSPEAAASMPSAFLTAYYALVVLGRLRRNEWILIHGAAGAVGLTALQIALWRGARVIATAGSTEKRDLVKLLGAHHVLDSRQMSFVDEIGNITGDGVDVVLNSLTGEAMERGLSVLKPFGRFLELGKRDYVANTHIGLRPFRRNLTYFGIDLFQLLSERPSMGSLMLKRCAALLQKGVLHPVPFCRYSATEVVEAFRLMQQSRHIGKIVVEPPKTAGGLDLLQTRFSVSPEKTYLITGAFSGFGLAAAKWLARRGARSMVLLGRRGPVTAEAQRLLAELHAIGVITRALACDVADFVALRQVFQTMPSQFPPFAEVMHAAMVLADATVLNMTAEQLDDVLRPKLLGAEYLDQLTRGCDLDYFVLFSSATTFVGSPAQGSYVAANAYMEGLARRRRREGLPAHAIAFGAIGDTGALARDHAARELLARRIGAKPMSANAALDLMAEALSEPELAEQAVLALAPIDWSAAHGQLPVLSSPTYQAIASSSIDPAKPASQAINLAGLIRTAGIEHAREAARTLVIEEVSRVLRMPKEQIGFSRPLAEVGLDSLMAVELANALRERANIEASLSGTAGSLTVAELVQQLLAASGGETEKHARSFVPVADDRTDGSKLSPPPGRTLHGS